MSKGPTRALQPRVELTGTERGVSTWIFASDMAASGLLRVLSVVVVFTRECLVSAGDDGFALAGNAGVGAIVAEGCRRRTLRQSPKVRSRNLVVWCVERRTNVIQIRPGKPTENAHGDSFHSLPGLLTNIRHGSNKGHARGSLPCFSAPVSGHLRRYVVAITISHGAVTRMIAKTRNVDSSPHRQTSRGCQEYGPE